MESSTYIDIFRLSPNFQFFVDKYSDTLLDVNENVIECLGRSRENISCGLLDGIMPVGCELNDTTTIKIIKLIESKLNLKTLVWTSVPIHNSSRTLVTGIASPHPKQNMYEQTDMLQEYNKLKLFEMFLKAPLGINCSDATGTIVWANEYLMDLLGYTAEEYIGHHRSEFYSEFDNFEEVFAQIRAGGTVRNLRGRMRCKDGTIRHIMVDSGPCFDMEGNFSHTGTFIRDDYEQLITEITLKEQLEKTVVIAREKDRFIRTMFHEIKTPLHVLSGTTHSLSISAERKGSVCYPEILPLQLQVDRCLGLVNDLSLAIMFESDKAIISRPQPMNIRKEIADILHPLDTSSNCGTENLNFTAQVDVDRNVPLIISVDKSLQRVIYNLITNAVKYCAPQGTVKTVVGYRQLEGLEGEITPTIFDNIIANNNHSNRGELQFSVTNITAQPLDLVLINKLFQSYLHTTQDIICSSSNRSSPRHSPRHSDFSAVIGDELTSSRALTDSLTSSEGLGLGLYVSYNIVQCLSGLLECSTTDDTVTFAFTVPVFALEDEVVLNDDKGSHMDLTPPPPENEISKKQSWSSVTNSMAGSRHMLGARAKMPELNVTVNTTSCNIASATVLPDSSAVGTHHPRGEIMPPSLLRSNHPKCRILVVDDSPICRKVLVRALETHGYATDTACDGQDACDKMAAVPCINDAVLMDLRMPIMDGLTATRILKDRPHITMVPIIIVTAEVGEEVRAAATDARANGFIEKPAKIDELLETLRTVISQHNMC